MNSDSKFGNNRGDLIPPYGESFGNSCQLMVDDSSQVLKILKNLYTEKHMCDVTFLVGRTEYPAHRLILCATSDVFQAMLMKPEWNECHESRVELQELPECERVFGSFLRYIYTGKILITHTNVMPILALADKYIVKSLSRLCLNFMSDHVAHAACYNQLFSWLQYTIPCGHTDIAKRCNNYIKWNLETVASTPDFSNFEMDMVIDLLKQHDVVILNEIKLFQCIINWVSLQKARWQKADLSKSELDVHMKQLMETVMSYVRFPMMSPRELADLLLWPLVREYKDFFVERMAIGMTYHSNDQNQMLELMADEDTRLQFIPRHYTSDSYSAGLLIDNVQSLPSYHTCTFVFSTHLSSAEYDSETVMEWVADFYPKGVWFQKCSLIIWQGTYEVPEEILRTVRLSLTCRELVKENMRVHVAVLIYGKENGTEYIIDVVEKVHHFSSQSRVLNIDNLIPFEELNMTCANECQNSRYLIGPNRSQVRLRIIITPTTQFCAKNVANK